MSSKNIADETARARKMLAKHEAWKFSSHNVRKMELLNARDQQVGQNSIVCIIGPNGARQFTVCHPIGITDLDDNDWVLLPTEEIPDTLARSVDPDAAEVNKLRAVYRNELLVRANLLQKLERDGSPVLYYPNDVVKPRVSVLNEAMLIQKSEKSALKKEISILGDKDPLKAQELNTDLQRKGNILNFISEKYRPYEVAIRKFVDDPSTVEKVAKKHPTVHRTLTGPFGDRKQRAITGAKGMPLVDVVGAVTKHMLSLDLTQQAKGNPYAKPEKAKPDVIPVSASGTSSMDMLTKAFSPKGKKN